MKQLNQLALMYRYLGDGDGDGILGLMEEAMGTEHLINYNHTFIFINLLVVRTQRKWKFSLMFAIYYQTMCEEDNV